MYKNDTTILKSMKYNWKLKWYVVVCIFIFFILLWLELLFDVIEKLIGVGINNNSTNYLIWVLITVVIIFYISFRQQINNNKFLSPFVSFFGSFLKKNKRLPFFWFIIITPLIIFIHYYILSNLFVGSFQKWDIFQGWEFKDITLLWLAIGALFIGAKIYFEIKESKTNTLNDYLRKAIDILADSKNNNEVYIIIPTTFLGEIHNFPLKNEFKDLIISKGNQEVTITIGVLNFEITEILDALNTHNESPKDLREFKGKLYKIIRDEKQLLIKFHNKFFEKKEGYSNENEHKTTNYFLNLFKHIEKLNEIKKIEIKHLKQMTSLETGVENGFFAIANLTNGHYYFGQFEIYNDSEQHFNGTYFQNSHIACQMRKMLNSYIDEYSFNSRGENKNN